MPTRANASPVHQMTPRRYSHRSRTEEMFMEHSPNMGYGPLLLTAAPAGLNPAARARVSPVRPSMYPTLRGTFHHSPVRLFHNRLKICPGE